MIDAEQLAERIILGILKNKKKSINLWMHNILKLYHLAPRTLENCLPNLFKTKNSD